MDGTEIIIETMANGFNDFHSLCRKAEAGESELQPSYMSLPIKSLAEGRKSRNLARKESFAQDYPLIASEAFIAAQCDSFIPADLVLRARKEKIEPHGPLVVGVDPAGMGTDATAIAWRQGSVITKVEKRRHLDTMQVAGWIASIIHGDEPVRVNIDTQMSATL